MKKTAVKKHSLYFNGRKTSVSLEDAFWQGLHEIAGYKSVSVPTLVGRIARNRGTVNLSSAIRIFVFSYVRARVRKNDLSGGKRKVYWRNTKTSYHPLPRSR
jgi:predicted DNA-binding ribbon-helix-helix protein